jgi:hypothetical protein
MKYIDKKGNIIDSGYAGDCLPISNARVLMVEELKKDMLLKLQKRQKAGKTDKTHRRTAGASSRTEKYRA